MAEARARAKEIVPPLADRLARLQQPDGSFRDPVFGYSDPRPAAEIGRAFLRLGRKGEARRALDWLLSVQHENGSWPETLPDQSEESCVATAIVGRLLLLAASETGEKRYREAALRAGGYLLSREFSPGYFIKSVRHYTDVLNVNATAGALLLLLAEETGERKYREARDRALFHTVRWQFRDGALPYGAKAEAFPDEWHLHVRDPHYQAITLYFLLLSDPGLESPYLRVAAPRAAAWLESVLRARGWDWSRGRLLFSLGTTASYAYAAVCFGRLGREEAAARCMEQLGTLQQGDGGFRRFEPPRAGETARGLLREIFDLEYSNTPGYPWPIRVRRALQRARRDLSERRNSKFSLYYSAQVLDCLVEMGAAR
jgi:hypothetical protein